MAWLAACGLLVVVATVGCGNQYKPVVTPEQPTGPAGQPEAFAVVTSEPNYNLLAPTTTNPCVLNTSSGTGPFPAMPYADSGVATVVDFSGDSISAQALIGNGPLTLALDPTGGIGYVPNCDGTISYFLPNGTLQTNGVYPLTLLNYPAVTNYAVPDNILALSGTIFAVEQGHDAIAEMAGSPPALVEEIPVAPSVINMTGIQGAQTIYAISQGNSLGGTQPAWGDCSNPSAVTTDGEADGIDLLISSTTTGTTTTTTTASQTVSSRIPLGVCPVYGVMLSNGERAFVMNRGSGTISVINSQQNALDTTNASPYVVNGTINLCNGATVCNAGPVYADLYPSQQLMVVANYGDGVATASDGNNYSGTISVIDVSLDMYGNDSSTFGKVLATIPVGANPAALTILQAPTQAESRVYVANQGTSTGGAYNNDGAVTIVNLGTYSVEKTIPIAANPRSIASTYSYPEGKVYVGSPNSSLLTVIRTDTDVLDTTIQMQGNITDVRTSTQYAGASATTATNNAEIETHSAGSGAP